MLRLCAFCEKTEDEVAKLVSAKRGNDVFICDECVSLCPELHVDGKETILANGNSVFIGKKGEKWYLKFRVIEGRKAIDTRFQLSEEAMDAMCNTYFNRIVDEATPDEEDFGVITIADSIRMLVKAGVLQRLVARSAPGRDR